MSSSGKGRPGRRRSAGAFDVRNVIAELIGLYGLVLVVVGLIDRSEATLAKTDGVNANLWAGLGMLVFAAAFALWSRLRPVVVDRGRDDRPGEQGGA
ncbi:phosphoethanolamine transferase CptA [Geodermatophilus sp. YIM 151500]|uniref:phosphoethanolamine transferase CptA n=1 Tax=Geodermatophilus sp. YIM 151500 TaxID=2984531 RepID=UPI0021E4729E|nr:phosphoethanolamine transferase CptA [Geodermatophilus sp. YIM 151500]MCV2488910.1 phosphoethanolamine transferase CptA [Geodermatophilus sp. YIM 151500]